MIYFLLSGCQRYVKIGHSRDPEKRAQQLQVGSPTQTLLLGEIKGTYLDEQLLHRSFNDLRVEGEWFEVRGRLLAYLEYLSFVAPRYPADVSSQKSSEIRSACWDVLPHHVLDEMVLHPEKVYDLYYFQCGNRENLESRWAEIPEHCEGGNEA